MDHLTSNIRFLRKTKGETQASFAERLGIKRSLLGAYEEGRARPNLDTQMEITRLFGISMDRLIREDLSKTSISALKSDQKTLKSAPLAQPARVLNITVDKQQRENIEFINQKASAGYLNGYEDMEYVKELPKFNLPFLNDGTYRAFEINGDSMLPIRPGTIIVGSYVESLQDLKDGHTYIVLTEQEGIVFKRVFSQLEKNGTLVLQSDNSSYSPFTVPGEEILELWEAKISIAKTPAKEKIETEPMIQMVFQLKQEVQQLKRGKK